MLHSKDSFLAESVEYLSDSDEEKQEEGVMQVHYWAAVGYVGEKASTDIPLSRLLVSAALLFL